MSIDRSSERLDDYERGLGDDAEVDTFEENLFSRALAGEAPELALRDSLIASLHAAARRGTLDPFPTAAEVAALRARPELRVAYFDLKDLTGYRVEPPADAEVVITRVPIDLTHVTRLDVEVGFEGDGVLKTMPDVSFDREDGAVYFCCEAQLARSIKGKPFGRFWSIEGDRRALIAEVVVATK